jgi:protoporphyrinogen/coproporphyrinogen III oxidase
MEPFVAGIFAGSAGKLSAAAAFPTLLEWESEHGSLLRGAIAARRSRPTGPPLPRGLLSFRDGLETLPRALDLALGAALRTGVAVRAIAPHDAAGWTVSTDAGDLEAHRLVVAVPASRAAELVAGFAPEAARALSEIPHPPLAVLHLSWPESALGRRLDGFGHLVCPDPRRRILGAVWSSALFPGRAPAGQALFTVFFGGTRDPEGATLPDDELTTLAARDFESEGLTRGSPRMILATRWPRAIPQYERGHAGRIAALAAAERRWPGLHLLGNYRGGISVADVVRAGMEIT